MALTLYLVRHGESEWNLAGRVQGQTAHPELTELGRAQALTVAAALAAIGPVDRVLTSDLVRARQTAAPIASALAVPAIEEVRLRENAMGELEGMHSSEAFLPERFVGWTPDTPIGGVGGESINEVQARVRALVDEIVADAELRSVVFVSHGGPIRSIVEVLATTSPDLVLDWDPDVIDNCSITKVVLDEGRLIEVTQVQSMRS